MILPLGIGVVHSFHEHDNDTCQAKNESHIHSEKTDCNDLHYFSQSISDFAIGCESLEIFQLFNTNEEKTEWTIVAISLDIESDRGPPVIKTF